MIRNDVFYKLPAGKNFYFIRPGSDRVLCYDRVVVRESLLTVKELKNAIDLGYVQAIRPSNNVERDILGVNQVKEEAPRKNISRANIVDCALIVAALGCVLALVFL